MYGIEIKQKLQQQQYFPLTFWVFQSFSKGKNLQNTIHWFYDWCFLVDYI